MSFDQGVVFFVLAAAMGLFVWGRWRYDVVAIVALLAVVYLGVVPPMAAFSGFGHPAVITVAAVLVVSRALQVSGVINHLARKLAPIRRTTFHQVAATSGLTAVLSAFMNNVGALALMLPVAIRNAHLAGRSPSQLLMPLSFASLLGGLITLIGTPPNIVIATFREQYTGTPFQMFDFAPVGLAVATVGIVYITTIGWRLIPHHRRGEADQRHLFQLEAYITEARVPRESPLVGKQIRELERLCENEMTVMSIIRGDLRLLAPHGVERVTGEDILILEGDPAALEPLFAGAKLKRTGQRDVQTKELRSDDIRLVEAVLMPNSPIEGQSMRGLRMHDRFGINLLAIARQGEPPKTLLGNTPFRTGDVLLLQGERNTMTQALSALGCLPLADRGLRVPPRRPVFLPIGVFALAILAAAIGVVPVQIAFVTAVAALILLGTLTLRDVYESIEWPIILLLGALIPIGEALQATGGTALIAGGILSLADDIPTWLMLALLMMVSMLLSDIIHNTPTAVLMAPIGAAVAQGLNLSIEPFLMAVAVGAASPYLTPIGHQSNTLVMGPGGYRFGDYARMGLPLEIIVIATATPMILWVWPL
ncbi:MAG: SLC13 family permease [Kiloniellales bacterium]|nr:SLC13 family permease [Kiloniellales bacterium]